jgi:diguanylate cyclase (GGDEF)-like protein
MSVASGPPAAVMPPDIGAGALLDALPDATAVLDRNGTIVAVNRAWLMFTADNEGNPDTTGVGVNYFAVCAASAAAGCADAPLVAVGLRAVFAGDTVECDLEYACPSSAVGRWFVLRVTQILGPEAGVLVSHVNISRQKMAERELERRASSDPLTGLANRMLFTQRLTSALTPRPARSRSPDVGLLYIDLDRFKPVNDSYGHAAGDEVLQAVASRLTLLTRPQDTVARLGGDEFALVAPRITADGLAQLVARIEDVLAEPHLIHGRRVEVGGSVGSYLALTGADVDECVRRADEAMYDVKRAGRR